MMLIEWGFFPCRILETAHPHHQLDAEKKEQKFEKIDISHRKDPVWKDKVLLHLFFIWNKL